MLQHFLQPPDLAGPARAGPQTPWHCFSLAAWLGNFESCTSAKPDPKYNDQPGRGAF